MITMAIKGIYDNIKKYEMDTSVIMEIFNNEYMLKYISLNCFMTCVIMDIDVKNHKLTYTSACHPALVLIKNGVMNLLDKTGKMIGIQKDSSYKSLEAEFSLGDKIYLFTDGIFEEFNSRREEFGEDRLYSILLENFNRSLKESIDNSLLSLDVFLNGDEKQDDITILGIEYKNIEQINLFVQ